jgi:putative membrane protein
MKTLLSIGAIVLGVAACGGSGGSNRANTPRAATRPVATTQPVDDDVQDALVELHQMGELLGESAKMAQKYGGSDAVKAFGKQLENDHKNIAATVKGTAARTGVQLNDAEQSGTYQEQLNDMRRISQLRGGEFDKEFLKDVVDSYDDLIDDLEDTAKNIQDRETKNTVLGLVPTLESHKKLAEQLQDQSS